MIAKTDAITLAARIVRCVDHLRRNRDAAMDALGGKGNRWNGQSCCNCNHSKMPANECWHSFKSFVSEQFRETVRETCQIQTTATTSLKPVGVKSLISAANE